MSSEPAFQVLVWLAAKPPTVKLTDLPLNDWAFGWVAVTVKLPSTTVACPAGIWEQITYKESSVFPFGPNLLNAVTFISNVDAWGAVTKATTTVPSGAVDPFKVTVPINRDRKVES